MALADVGVVDVASGVGIADIAVHNLIIGAITRQVQLTDNVSIGDRFTIKMSGSFTPVTISETQFYNILGTFTLPSNRSAIIDRASFIGLGADQHHLLIAKRFLLAGNNATSAPAAPSAPTVALVSHNAGMDVGTYKYKICALDMFNKEAAISPESGSVTTTSTSRRVDITLPALPTGGVAWRIYRTLAGGSTFYFCDEETVSPYEDVMPDSQLTQATTPSLSWGTSPTLDTTVGFSELIFEVASTLSAAPTRLVYRNEDGKSMNAVIAPPTSIGTRYRIKLNNESRGFVTTPTATSLFRKLDRVSDFGAVSVDGFDLSNTAIGGQWAVWGFQRLGSTTWGATPPAGSVFDIKFDTPIYILPNEEIVILLGATAGAGGSVRDIALNGRVFSV